MTADLYGRTEAELRQSTRAITAERIRMTAEDQHRDDRADVDETFHAVAEDFITWDMYLCGDLSDEDHEAAWDCCLPPKHAGRHLAIGFNFGGEFGVRASWS